MEDINDMTMDEILSPEPELSPIENLNSQNLEFEEDIAGFQSLLEHLQIELFMNERGLNKENPVQQRRRRRTI